MRIHRCYGNECFWCPLHFYMLASVQSGVVVRATWRSYFPFQFIFIGVIFHFWRSYQIILIAGVMQIVKRWRKRHTFEDCSGRESSGISQRGRRTKKRRMLILNFCRITRTHNHIKQLLVWMLQSRLSSIWQRTVAFKTIFTFSWLFAQSVCVCL